ncbi:Xaa-Pro dipeptidase [Kordiimonas sediminis]|uniref:Xaa-Pro dipeptidase n=1 Tax=Kordiimonas sediminis TaxID=1735581 RepID=A0A919AT73_9PROT|nr:amidohydrolase family protein [Kordiimonas sediminis]GHF23051.1 Xaa-Pro dipeptidase [Kordiimonas sediminis]
MRSIFLKFFVFISMLSAGLFGLHAQDAEKDKAAKDEAAVEKTESTDKAEKKEKKKSVTVIHAGRLLAAPGEDVLTEKSIIVEGNKITKVVDGYVSAEDAGHADATVADMTTKFVMPGMMDMHVHLMGERGVSNPNAGDYAIAGVVNSSKTLMAGFTTVRDLGARDGTIFKLRKRMDKGDIPGPRIFSSGQTIGVGGRSGDNNCNGVESCRKFARDNIRAGAEWLKIYSSCSGFQMCSEEDFPTVFFDDEIKAIFAVAEKYRIPVAAHSHPRDSALYVLENDVKSIEHGTFMDTKALKLMKKKGVYYIPTLAVQDFLADMQKKDSTTEKVRLHNDHFIKAAPETVKEAYSLGVPLATGSDAGVAPHGENYRELEWLVDLGVTTSDVLKMATVNGADLLGKSDELGTVEAGKLADIIAIDGDPLADIKDIRKVSFVMKDGRIYKKD